MWKDLTTGIYNRLDGRPAAVYNEDENMASEA